MLKEVSEIENHKFKKSWLWAIIPGALIFIAAVFFITLLLIRVFWAWIIPDLSPGAVSSGLIANTISWFTAFKVAIVTALLAGFVRGGRGYHRHRHPHDYDFDKSNKPPTDNA